MVEDIENAFADNDDSSSRQTYATGGILPAAVQQQQQHHYHHQRQDLSATDQVVIDESRSLFYIKVASIAVLMIAATVVSVSVYFITSRQEQVTMQIQFHHFASATLDAFEENLGRALSTADLLSVMITSMSDGERFRWPNVTIPYFEASATQCSRLAGTTSISFTPLVRKQDRAGWEAYAMQNQDWIQQSLEWKNTHLNFYLQASTQSTNNFTNFTIPPEIHAYNPKNYHSSYQYNNDPGPYAPLWQIFPIPEDSPNAINLDQLSIPGYATPLGTLIDNQVAIITDFLGNTSDSPNNKLSGPWSALFYPVYQSFQMERNNLGGFLSLTIDWMEYLQRSLDRETVDSVAIIRSSCGQSYTFEIEANGTVVALEGDTGSYYDSSLGENRDLWKYLKSLPGSSSVSNVGCHFTIEIYPTFQVLHVKRRSGVYAAVVVGAFAVSLIVLLVYDHLIKRRIRVLKQQAERSNVIVSQLFPPIVRDRLLRNGADTPQVLSRTKPNTPSTAVHNNLATHNNNNNNNKTANAVGSKLESTVALPGTSFLSMVGDNPTQQLKKFLNGVSAERKGGYTNGSIKDSKPIADLFPDTTVMFADIAGFTAWSSAREPSQVFTLLESIFGGMDAIARRKGVFKVETIGDCYMAVTGLPDPQEDHAVIMASFARACLKKVAEITSRLKDTLGPETGDLYLRIGLHSGPVTAGVLRGEKSRFQLFGDTVNTASRIESNGSPDRIHLSQETADWLIAAGKSSWIRVREDLITAKGKGQMQTYWMVTHDDRYHSETESSAASQTSDVIDSCHSPVPRRKHCTINKKLEDAMHIPPDNKVYASPSHELTPASIAYSRDRRDSIQSYQSSNTYASSSVSESQHKLIEWTTEVLLAYIKAFVARRSIAWRLRLLRGTLVEAILPDSITEPSISADEIDKPISFPESKGNQFNEENTTDADSMEVPHLVVQQLWDYVATISSLYHYDNAYHNFEHASHVIMSADRLFKRLSPASSNQHENKRLPSNPWEKKRDKIANIIHLVLAESSSTESMENEMQLDDVLPLISDPFTQFALVFAALIHDVDHPGEETNVPKMLNQRKKSPADNYTLEPQFQSFHVAWDLLMRNDRYCDLRKCIIATPCDAQRFRQVVVHCVIAPIWFNKTLASNRRKNWTLAFHQVDTLPPVADASSRSSDDSTQKIVNLQATCILEHAMQAADVSHKMQSWQIYQKWVEKLFLESYSKRLTKLEDNHGETLCKYDVNSQNELDPSTWISWYEGELLLFDNYVIPLANKLKECGALGAASDEYLNNAIENRQEWMMQGQEFIATVLASLRNSRHSGSYLLDP